MPNWDRGSNLRYDAVAICGLLCGKIKAMEIWQKGTVLVYGLFALVGFLTGLRECRVKKNSYGKTHIFNLLGAFAWGDAVIFGLFWALVSLAVFWLNDWLLFLLFLAIFWLVRSFGETVYWFNQQFARADKNPSERFWFTKIFHNESVWFVHQVIWQCVLVVSIILSLYLAKLWLQR